MPGERLSMPLIEGAFNLANQASSAFDARIPQLALRIDSSAVLLDIDHHDLKLAGALEPEGGSVSGREPGDKPAELVE